MAKDAIICISQESAFIGSGTSLLMNGNSLITSGYTETSGSNVTLNESESKCSQIIQLVTNSNSLLLLFLTLTFNFTLFSTYFLLPLVGNLVPGWSLTYLAATLSIHGVAYFTVIAMCSRLLITDEVAFVMMVLSVVGFVLSRVLLTLLSFVTISTDTTPSIIIVNLIVLLCTLGFAVKDALLPSLLPQVVGGGEGMLLGLRELATCLAILLAAITTPFAGARFALWCMVVGVVNVVLLVAILVRRDKFVFSRKMRFLSSLSVSTRVNVTRVRHSTYSSTI